MKRTVLAITFALIVPAAAPPASAQGTWVTKAPLPTLRSGFPVAALNGLLYAIGGQNPNPTSVVEVYNPATDSWSTAAPLPVPIQRASATVVNGVLYVVGGCADIACASLLNTVYAYDPTTSTWTQRASIPTPRRDPNFLAVVNGIIYAAGGGQGPGCSAINSLEAYNPSNDTWTALPSMPVPHWTAEVAALNGKIYVTGGTQCSGQTDVPVTETDVFDPSTNTWTQAAPIPFAENSGEGVALNGKLYVMDGAASGACDACTEVYDSVSNTWASNSPDPMARFGAQGDVINGTLYVVGGANLANTTILSTNEAFTPVAATVTTLTSSANPSDSGDGVTFTASVTSASGTPTGSITLSDGSTVLATLPSPFPGVFSTSSLVAGSHNITAQFTPADPTSFAPSNSSLMETIISLSQLPLLSGNNTFTGNQLVNGTVTASSFLGNGAGLTNVTASALSCAACIGNTQLAINYAAGDAQGGNALNALMFGGLTPSAFASSFAPASGSGVYVAKAGDTMTGTLNLPANGLVAGTNQLVLSGGNVGIGTTTPQSALDVAGLGNFSGATNTFNSAILRVSQSSNGAGPDVTVPNLPPTAVRGDATATTDQFTHGVTGTSQSSNGRGVVGIAYSTTGGTRGVNAISYGDAGAGITAFEVSPTGSTVGIYALSSSPQGIGGQFENSAGGQILSGLNNGVEKFRVDGNGNVTATSFFGNGAGLTNVTATNAGTASSASSLSCTGCVGNTQLGVNYAGSASQGGPATTALSALQSNNALALGGIGPSGYAPATGSTAYVAKAGDTMTGNLTLPTLNASGTVSAGGSLVVGGGTPILQHISILVNPSFTALKPGACATANFTLTGAADGDTIALGVPNARMTGGGSLIYTAWVSAADTITVQACNANANSPQKTAGTGSIRVDLWKH